LPGIACRYRFLRAESSENAKNAKNAEIGVE
jgi:hypothetical protein